MLNFADQCLDMAQSILGHNLNSINEDGSINPTKGETSRFDEPGHAALAIGEYYRATGEKQLGNYDLIDLAARCITAQVFTEEENENGLAYSALGLLSFGPSKDRNPVWERLLDPTREHLDKRLLARSDYNNHLQAYNIAKSVARFSMGLSKKDETGRLIDRFIERINENSTGGYCDDAPEVGLGGVYNINGILSFVFIRQTLQLHANIHLRDRKLPSLRTFAEKYIRMMPDIVREDGLGWIYGEGIGAYGQMLCISIILQAMRDDWINEDQKPHYFNILRRLFQYFFMTYLDQEEGVLIVKDNERTTIDEHTSRLADFDGARYLCQWSRLAKSIGGSMDAKALPKKATGRFVVFDKDNRRERGVFIYKDPDSGLHINLPLVGQGKRRNSDSLSFPHSPGIFDWPVNNYAPIMIPELTFGDKVIVPSFYGHRCITGLGLRNSFYFRFEQPELITREEKIVSGLGSVKVSWTFSGNKVTSDFIFKVKNQIQMDQMRYVFAIAANHSTYQSRNAYQLGREGLRCEVHKDDFQAIWQKPEMVTNEPNYKTYWGNIHYMQLLIRDHALIMRPNQQYRLTVSFQPDITFVGENS